ncbi:MAG: monovalent cation:proton antiporter-2 (CPA2) family protein [Pseudomonadota bacterium]
MEGLLLIALFYLAAGVISVPIAQRLGLGSVLGYLIAGALIGPFALELVGDQTRVMHFAEFGVVIMLFLIGLEIRPSLLWSMRKTFFGLGGAQVLLTGIALAIVSMLLGLDWHAAIAVGFILSLSSTAIVLQTLEEKNLRQTATGSAAFGILLFQDLSIIPLFALLPLLGVAGEGSHTISQGILAHFPLWIRTAGIAGAITLVILVGRYLMHPIFRFIATTHSREIFTATALLLVIAVALLMQAVGLSAALGAFLAGVVLADSEFRRELEADIEPFRSLLLGLFFMSVGASLDLGLVGAKPFLLGGMVIGLMSIKFAIVFVVMRLFGNKAGIAAQTAAALGQGGEFAFVLLGVATSYQVVSENIASLVTAAVAVSMALTPIALILYDKFYRNTLPPKDEPEKGHLEERPDAIIAGFGRFGQIASRLLIVNGFKTSTLDSSSEQVGLVRRFGRRVYYGDATRLDLLRAAGAADAKILVVAIDGRDQAENLVEMARKHFPHLKILARAFDRRHAYRLLDKGAHVVERETFEAGLTLGQAALEVLGFQKHHASSAARLFRRHDEEVFYKLADVWSDEERYMIASRETSERMNELLAADIQRMIQASPGDTSSKEN